MLIPYIIGILCVLLMDKRPEKTILIILLTLLTICLLICLSMSFEIKEDRLIIRGSTESVENKKYKARLKKRNILIKNMRSIYVSDMVRHWSYSKVPPLEVVIVLKNGDKTTFSIAGYSKKDQIKALITDVQKQINECSEENSLH